MNQPYSSCLTHYEELIQISTTLHSHQVIPLSQIVLTDDVAESSNQQIPEQELNLMDTTSDNWQSTAVDRDQDSNGHCPTIPHFQPEPASKEMKIKRHPNSADTFGYGKTFLENFEKDDYAQERRKQLYYPFASRNEWEMASFLLRSHISMVAIDRFLKLEMVSVRLLKFDFCSFLQ